MARYFLNRHKQKIGQRFASNITRARSAVGRSTIEEYFNNLQSVKENVPSSNIFNYDETNLSDDPGKRKYLFSKGVKYPERIINHSKSSTSMMVCCSASGILLPPYIIYRGNVCGTRGFKTVLKEIPVVLIVVVFLARRTIVQNMDGLTL